MGDAGGGGAASDDAAGEALRELGERLATAVSRFVDAAARALDTTREEFARLAREAEAERAAWDADHPGVPYGSRCGCLCPVMAHQGICVGDAVDAVPRVSPALGPYTLLLCGPCASALDERDELRAVAARVNAEEADG